MGTQNNTYKNDIYSNRSHAISNALFQTEMWISMTLSSLSFLSLILFVVVYAIARIRTRDHARESRRTALKKLCKHEYLVLSYSLSLMASHFVNVVQKVIQFLLVTESKSPPSDFCLAVGILKHFFWLLAIFHCGAISFKLYVKIKSTMDNSIIERNDWLKPIIITLAIVLVLAVSIVTISIILHYTIKPSKVYHFSSDDVLDHRNRFKNISNFCFLKQPQYLLVLFVLPIFCVFVFDFVIFLILFFKTKPVLNPSSSEADTDQGHAAVPDAAGTNSSGSTSTPDDKANHLFLKLAILMGLSWIIYAVSICLAQIPGIAHFTLTMHLLGSLQTNIQGFLLVLVLFSNATYERLFSKRSSRGTKKNKNNNKHDKNEPIRIHPVQQRLTVL